MKKILVYLLLTVLLLGFNDKDIVDNYDDVWYRTVPDPDNPGKILLYKLDMSAGYAYCDGYYIYIVMNRLETGTSVVMSFENGKYWINEGSYWLDMDDTDYDNKSQLQPQKDDGVIENLK